VVHHGELVLTRSFGALDPRVENPVLPNHETLYTLCSISKTLVSAAVGILVEEGKLKWTDAVGAYLPEFKPKDDHRVATKATFNDFLRHSGGLSNPVITILAQEGKVLVPQRDFIELVNDAPTGGMFAGPQCPTRDRTNALAGIRRQTADSPTSTANGNTRTLPMA
jgi:CubicO group peptidase (beta-lactamase class C family)